MSTFDIGNPGFCPGCGMHYSKEHLMGCPIVAMLRYAELHPPEEGPSLPCERCGAHIDDCNCFLEFAPEYDTDELDDDSWGGER